MKSIYKSKTIIWNVLTVVIVFATMFGYTPNQELATQVSTFLVAANPFINLVLRFLTKTSVKVF